MPNFEKFGPGHFTPTPEEKKKNPDIEKKMAVANEALRRKAAEQARESLGKEMERSFKDEEERPEEDLEKVEVA